MLRLRAKSGSTLLVLAIMLAPVLCCCPVKQAAASMATQRPTAHDCCDEQSQPAHPSQQHPEDECGCGGRISLAEPNNAVLWTAPVDTHLLPVAAFIEVAIDFHAGASDPHSARTSDRHPPPIPDSLFARHCLITT
jgi:hypothetical protein